MSGSKNPRKRKIYINYRRYRISNASKTNGVFTFFYDNCILFFISLSLFIFYIIEISLLKREQILTLFVYKLEMKRVHID